MSTFMVFTLPENKFTLLSAQEISKIGCKLVTHNKQFFMHHFMAGMKLEYYVFNKQRQVTKLRDDSCVIDYVSGPSPG